MSTLVNALTEKEAATAPDSEDLRLRGRTYTIPFDPVWEASIAVIRNKLRGWVVVLDDDRAGRITALSTSFFRRLETEVIVKIGLDENGQTRVDVRAVSRTERRDWGRSRRLIGAFIGKLDRELGVVPSQILDPALLPHLQESA